MARPQKKDKLVPFTVMLQQKDINDIKKIAEKAELPAGKLARNCLLIGLDEARALNRFGLARLIGGSRRTIDRIKKQMNIKTSNEDIDTNE